MVIKAVDVLGRTWDVPRCLLQDPAARAEVEALRPAVAEASLLRILEEPEMVLVPVASAGCLDAWQA